MTTTKRREMIRQACAEIAKILQELEAGAGLKVDHVEIEDTDITTCGDEVSQVLRNIYLQVEVESQTQWAC